MSERVYTAVIGTAIGVIRVMDWPVTVMGAEHIPSTGPAVLGINHIGYLDFVFAGYAARFSGRRVRFLAKKEVFEKKGIGWLMRQMGHIPVDRHGAAQDSMSTSIAELERGEMIGMFPEGTISPSFVPRRGKTGTVRIAQKTGAPLIPVAVWGTQRILTKWRPKNFKRHIPILVNIGAPMEFESGLDVQECTDLFIARIAELVIEAQEAYPDVPKGPEDSWWMPAHLGGSAPTVEEANARLAIEQSKRRT